jgi:hypothetical protein
VTRRIDLVADGIENPGNARALLEAAGMFGGACLFRRRGHGPPGSDEADALAVDHPLVNSVLTALLIPNIVMPTILREET